MTAPAAIAGEVASKQLLFLPEALRKKWVIVRMIDESISRQNDAWLWELIFAGFPLPAG
jgi:hypothetical protein